MFSLSWWEKDFYFNDAEVVIIGAGIVGLSTAIELKLLKPNTSILILERGQIPSGASTKNAGFACFGEIGELQEIERKHGREALITITQQKIEGLSILLNRCKDLIDYQQSKGYELYDEQSNTAEILSGIEYYNTLFYDEKIITEPVFKSVNHRIAPLGFQKVKHLIENSFEGELNPMKMIHRLHAIAINLGIKILYGCKVDAIEAQKIMLSHGFSFGYQKVVLCTNAFTPDLDQSANVTPGRGQVLITKPIKGIKLTGTFHYNKGYVYFRNVDGRLLIGGGRDTAIAEETTTALEYTEKIQNYLKLLCKEMFIPNHPIQVEHVWSGIMGFGDSLFPEVKKMDDHTYCAYRMNGMGVALGSYTGKTCAHLLAKDL